MSRELLSRNPDLQQLVNEGYTLDIIRGKLIVRDIPFVDSSGIVHDDGFLVMALELAGDIAQAPSDHTASFGGGVPCTSTGAPLDTVVNGRGQADQGDGVITECTCSMKPIDSDGRYPDFHSKVVKYVSAISGHARALDPGVKATVFRPIEETAGASPFLYANTASSRAGIDALNAKLRGERIAIVGLGGTGEYILDFTSKTEAQEIHLFDDDEFLSHNAFRAPGAATLEMLREAPMKVDHFRDVYGHMRSGIVAHPYRIEAHNVGELEAMTFVFLAIDHPPGKKPIMEALVSMGIPFVDVGMGIEEVDGRITGSLRTTVVSPAKNDHTGARIPTDDATGPDEYRTNIQIAELNARNATDAVIAWKQHRGFYADLGREHHSVFSIPTNHTFNGELLGATDDGDPDADQPA